MTKNLLITGCSSGIGEATAHMARERGYRVIATARSETDTQRLAGQGFTVLRLDLNSSESIEEAVEQLSALLDGDLDAVFHNGAYGQPGALEDLSREALRQQFETNLFGWHELNNRLLPILRAQGRGHIIFNSSVLGLVCMPYRGAYNASKFALEAYADTLRMELNGSGIRVVLVEPGPIESRFRQNAYAAFMRHVDRTASLHRKSYDQMIARLQQPGATSRFTLEADAVAAKVLKSIEARRSKTRYYVTFPTYLFAFLKRLLPAAVLDSLLRRG